MVSEWEGGREEMEEEKWGITVVKRKGSYSEVGRIIKGKGNVKEMVGRRRGVSECYRRGRGVVGKWKMKRMVVLRVARK